MTQEQEEKNGAKRHWFSPWQPLWLPAGSVRAIMVLAFTFAVVFPLLKFSTLQQEIPQTVKEVILFMAGSLYPIIQAYFEARVKETAAAAEIQRAKVMAATRATADVVAELKK